MVLVQMRFYLTERGEERPQVSREFGQCCSLSLDLQLRANLSKCSQTALQPHHALLSAIYRFLQCLESMELKLKHKLLGI